MCTLDRFYVEVEGTSGGVGADGGISRICEWTRLSVAKSSDVKLVSAEVLVFARPREVVSVLVLESFSQRVGYVNVRT